jgi:DNA modification methylase
MLIRADALCVPLKTNSVDLVVTSPPYFNIRKYKDNGEDLLGQIGLEDSIHEYLESLWAVTEECIRILKPNGNLFVNMGDKYINKSLAGLPWRYANGCVDSLGLLLRSEIVWSKTNPMPEPVSDRVKRSHESWFHLSLQKDHYANMDDIREEYAEDTARRYSLGFRSDLKDERLSTRVDLSGKYSTNPLGKIPGSVWEIPTESLHIPKEIDAKHYAAFPSEFPRRIILGWSPPGGVVFDPFVGTGTTVLSAQQTGRTGIGSDLSRDYLSIAGWRTG